MTQPKIDAAYASAKQLYADLLAMRARLGPGYGPNVDDINKDPKAAGIVARLVQMYPDVTVIKAGTGLMVVFRDDVERNAVRTYQPGQ